jgi:endogenous inhibitor of DNA gyrase (YacG/DUF329 family)
MSDPENSAPTKRCAICGKPALARFTPFCSGRCADVDLNRWLSGSYAIPTSEVPDDEELRPDDTNKHQE